MTPGLPAAAAVMAAAVAWWELGHGRGVTADPARGPGPEAALPEAAARLGLAPRLSAAGLAGRVSPRALLVAKALAAWLGSGIAAMAAPAAPGRLSAAVWVVLPIAGFLAPDAMLERRARHRRRQTVAALPDALDLLAVGVSAGRSAGVVMAEIAARTSGPLAEELAVAAAEIGAGASQVAALREMRRRSPAPEMAGLVAAVERSHRHGSPLADRLRDQASGLRRAHRRRVEEAAARAAPKIQLVVALVLVPSVLLMILAGLVAHAGGLAGGFAG